MQNNSSPPTPARVSKLRGILERYRTDLFLVTKPANVSYLSGFSGEDSFLLISKKDKFFITDSRYIESAGREAKGYEVVEYSGGVEVAFARLVKKLNARRIGIEYRNIRLRNYESLKSYLLRRELIPVDNAVEELRQIKDEWEIKRIREASDIALHSLSAIRKNIKPGVTELELAGHLEYQMRMHGAERSAFEIIVATGANSSMPHARPGAAKIKANGHILIDFGARVARYNCDLTRVFFLGKIDKKIQEIRDIVKTAQERAIAVIRPGVPIKEVDSAAREWISKCGFGKFFRHATGHGIGLEVHELPSVSPRNQEILKKGMVFSVEPAIYLPGEGGIRLEETVLVTDRGGEILTK